MNGSANSRSLRAKRSNPESFCRDSLDCFATFAMTVESDRCCRYDNRISSSRRPSPFSKLLHRAGRHDLAVIGVGFVVLLDVVEAVEVVDHHAGGFAHALRRDRRAS